MRGTGAAARAHARTTEPAPLQVPLAAKQLPDTRRPRRATMMTGTETSCVEPELRKSPQRQSSLMSSHTEDRDERSRSSTPHEPSPDRTGSPARPHRPLTSGTTGLPLRRLSPGRAVDGYPGGPGADRRVASVARPAYEEDGIPLARVGNGLDGGASPDRWPKVWQQQIAAEVFDGLAGRGVYPPRTRTLPTAHAPPTAGSGRGRGEEDGGPRSPASVTSSADSDTLTPRSILRRPGSQRRAGTGERRIRFAGSPERAPVTPGGLDEDGGSHSDSDEGPPGSVSSSEASFTEPSLSYNDALPSRPLRAGAGDDEEGGPRSPPVSTNGLPSRWERPTAPLADPDEDDHTLQASDRRQRGQPSQSRSPSHSMSPVRGKVRAGEPPIAPAREEGDDVVTQPHSHRPRHGAPAPAPAPRHPQGHPPLPQQMRSGGGTVARPMVGGAALSADDDPPTEAAADGGVRARLPRELDLSSSDDEDEESDEPSVSYDPALKPMTGSTQESRGRPPRPPARAVGGEASTVPGLPGRPAASPSLFPHDESSSFVMDPSTEPTPTTSATPQTSLECSGQPPPADLSVSALSSAEDGQRRRRSSVPETGPRSPQQPRAPHPRARHAEGEVELVPTAEDAMAARRMSSGSGGSTSSLSGGRAPSSISPDHNSSLQSAGAPCTPPPKPQPRGSTAEGAERTSTIVDAQSRRGRDKGRRLSAANAAAPASPAPVVIPPLPRHRQQRPLDSPTDADSGPVGVRLEPAASRAVGERGPSTTEWVAAHAQRVLRPRLPDSTAEVEDRSSAHGSERYGRGYTELGGGFENVFEVEGVDPHMRDCTMGPQDRAVSRSGSSRSASGGVRPEDFSEEEAKPLSSHVRSNRSSRIGSRGHHHHHHRTNPAEDAGDSLVSARSTSPTTTGSVMRRKLIVVERRRRRGSAPSAADPVVRMSLLPFHRAPEILGEAAAGKDLVRLFDYTASAHGADSRSPSAGSGAQPAPAASMEVESIGGRQLFRRTLSRLSASHRTSRRPSVAPLTPADRPVSARAGGGSVRGSSRHRRRRRGSGDSPTHRRRRGGDGGGDDEEVDSRTHPHVPPRQEVAVRPSTACAPPQPHPSSSRRDSEHPPQELPPGPYTEGLNDAFYLRPAPYPQQSDGHGALPSPRGPIGITPVHMSVFPRTHWPDLAAFRSGGASPMSDGGEDDGRAARRVRAERHAQAVEALDAQRRGVDVVVAVPIIRPRPAVLSWTGEVPLVEHALGEGGEPYRAAPLPLTDTAQPSGAAAEVPLSHFVKETSVERVGGQQQQQQQQQQPRLLSDVPRVAAARAAAAPSCAPPLITENLDALSRAWQNTLRPSQHERRRREAEALLLGSAAEAEAEADAARAEAVAVASEFRGRPAPRPDGGSVSPMGVGDTPLLAMTAGRRARSGEGRGSPSVSRAVLTPTDTLTNAGAAVRPGAVQPQQARRQEAQTQTPLSAAGPDGPAEEHGRSLRSETPPPPPPPPPLPEPASLEPVTEPRGPPSPSGVPVSLASPEKRPEHSKDRSGERRRRRSKDARHEQSKGKAADKEREKSKSKRSKRRDGSRSSLSRSPERLARHGSGGAAPSHDETSLVYQLAKIERARRRAKEEKKAKRDDQKKGRERERGKEREEPRKSRRKSRSRSPRERSTSRHREKDRSHRDEPKKYRDGEERKVGKDATSKRSKETSKKDRSPEKPRAEMRVPASASARSTGWDEPPPPSRLPNGTAELPRPLPPSMHRRTDTPPVRPPSYSPRYPSPYSSLRRGSWASGRGAHEASERQLDPEREPRWASARSTLDNAAQRRRSSDHGLRAGPAYPAHPSGDEDLGRVAAEGRPLSRPSTRWADYVRRASQDSALGGGGRPYGTAAAHAGSAHPADSVTGRRRYFDSPPRASAAGSLFGAGGTTTNKEEEEKGGERGHRRAAAAPPPPPPPTPPSAPRPQPTHYTSNDMVSTPPRLWEAYEPSGAAGKAAEVPGGSRLSDAAPRPPPPPPPPGATPVSRRGSPEEIVKEYEVSDAKAVRQFARDLGGMVEGLKAYQGLS